VKSSKKFVCFAIDTYKMHKTVKIVFKVRSSPRLIFMDCFGNFLNTLSSSAYSMSPAAFEKIMKRALKRNAYAVKKYKAEEQRRKKKVEDIKAEFAAADKLMDQGKFDEAKAAYEKLSKNTIDKDIAEWADLRIKEIGIGMMLFEAKKLLDEGNFEEAEKKLRAVSRARSDRYSDKAAYLLEELPAAKLYNEACADMKAGKNYQAMQKLQKILQMEYVYEYKKKAEAKLKEIKDAWGKKK
jgi:outer membrane protein assembly factor BamD (BamD/ComL family)